MADTGTGTRIKFNRGINLIVVYKFIELLSVYVLFMLSSNKLFVLNRDLSY